MTQRERIEYARNTGHWYPLRTSSETDPHFADQHERIAALRGSSQLDDRQVASVRDEPDVQLESHTATAANVSSRHGTRRSTRPPLARLESRPLTSGNNGAIDLFRRCATQRFMRPVAVVPVDVQR